MQVELSRRPANVVSQKFCRLKYDSICFVIDTAVESAHHTADSAWLFDVANHKHSVVKNVFFLVERNYFLSVFSSSRYNFSALDIVFIKCVHRLSYLDKHVVGNVNDIVDRSQTDRFQPFLYNFRTVLNFYVTHSCRHISRTQLFIFNVYVYNIAYLYTLVRLKRNVRHFKRFVEHGCDFSRYAKHTVAV